MAMADKNGFIGYVSVATYDSEPAQKREDFGPVYNEEDDVVGYWGKDVGFVDKATYEAGAPLDFDAIRAASSPRAPLDR
jgi:hypothetical protein